MVDVNDERSIKIFKLAGGRSDVTFGNRRYPDYNPGPDAGIDIRQFRQVRDGVFCRCPAA